ncbi:DUF6817 domain-containing protein [Zooshikella sp. RANM57]|uniref:DUF6817 domain-containing protein n=1 Tax=Zooshikella sp. RANM57 TaxID=3425863 RepID=UPI003D6E3973
MASFIDIVNFLTINDLACTPHKGRTYLGHSTRVYICMKGWGCADHICDAAFFQSVYGTQTWQRKVLPIEQRSELTDLIGEKAERLVFTSCFMERGSFYEQLQDNKKTFPLIHRINGELITLTQHEYDELATIQLADFLQEYLFVNGSLLRNTPVEALAKRAGGGGLSALRCIMLEGYAQALWAA